MLYKGIKALMADFKKIYTASTENTALLELENFAEKIEKNTGSAYDIL